MLPQDAVDAVLRVFLLPQKDLRSLTTAQRRLSQVRAAVVRPLATVYIAARMSPQGPVIGGFDALAVSNKSEACQNFMTVWWSRCHYMSLHGGKVA